MIKEIKLPSESELNVNTKVIVVELCNHLKMTDWRDTDVLQLHSKGVGSWWTIHHGFVSIAILVEDVDALCCLG